MCAGKHSPLTIRGAHWPMQAVSASMYATERSRSNAHLPPAEVGQVVLGGAALKIDLEVHGREVRRRAAGEIRRHLLGKVGAVLGAIRGRTDIDDARVLGAGVLV